MNETWGDIARVKMPKRNCLYFADVLDDIKKRLSLQSSILLSAACAERMLMRHLALPPDKQRKFTTTWRVPMDALWRALSSAGRTSDKKDIEDKLYAFYESPLNHSNGQDGPDDADDDAAAACIYACEAFFNGNSDSAFYAVSRLVADAFARIPIQDQDIMRDNVDNFVEDCCHRLVQEELHWLLDMSHLLHTPPLTDNVIAEVHKLTLTGQ